MNLVFGTCVEHIVCYHHYLFFFNIHFPALAWVRGNLLRQIFFDQVPCLSPTFTCNIFPSPNIFHRRLEMNNTACVRVIPINNYHAMSKRKYANTHIHTLIHIFKCTKWICFQFLSISSIHKALFNPGL